jgi:hypothetical protein
MTSAAEDDESSPTAARAVGLPVGARYPSNATAVYGACITYSGVKTSASVGRVKN